jgi:hypothetical protein
MRKPAALIGAVLTGLVLVAPAAADREDAKPPVGSCPGNYAPVDASEPPIGAFVDLNDDGIVCFSIFKGAAEEILFANVIDNIAAPR